MVVDRVGGLKWTLEDPGDAALARYGHAVCAWKGKLVMLGGSRLYNREQQKRECLGDIRTFDPREGTHWQEMKCKGVFVPRRGHVACTVGDNLLAHGGMDSLGNYIDEASVINLGRSSKPCAWARLRTDGEKAPALAYHSAQLVLASERLSGSLSIYKLPLLSEDEESKIAMEGLYVFGGMDAKGTASNELYVLRIGQNPCHWTKPQVEGMPPPARYGHSMIHYPGANILVIFGGRNNDARELTTSYYGDVWVLALEKRLVWTQWVQRGSPAVPAVVPEARYSHCACLFGAAILVFGGLTEGNYCRATVCALRLGQNPDPVPLSHQPHPIAREDSPDKETPQSETVELPSLTLVPKKCGQVRARPNKWKERAHSLLRGTGAKL